MALAYIREMSVGEIFGNALQLYRKYFLPLTLAYALPNLPGQLFYTYGFQGKDTAATVIGFILLTIGSFVSYTAITLCIADACVGNRPNLRRSFLRTRATAGSLFLTSFVQVLVISVGIILLIVPGVIFFLWYVLSPIIVVLEGRGGIGALKRSRTLTQGHRWRILSTTAIMVTALLAVWIVGYVIVLLLGYAMHAGGAADETVMFTLGLLMAVLGWILTPTFFIGLVLIYFDLRARKEAFDSVALAAELGS
jgi:hypothetical protein